MSDWAWVVIQGQMMEFFHWRTILEPLKVGFFWMWWGLCDQINDRAYCNAVIIGNLGCISSIGCIVASAVIHNEAIVAVLKLIKYDQDADKGVETMESEGIIVSRGERRWRVNDIASKEQANQGIKIYKPLSQNLLNETKSGVRDSSDLD